MKLSEMTNKEAFKVIAVIMPTAKEILKDEYIMDVWFKKLDHTPGADLATRKKEKVMHNIDRMGELIPYLLDNHAKRIFKILAVLNGKKPKEIEDQKFFETVAQLTEALNDEALVKLFTA